MNDPPSNLDLIGGCLATLFWMTVAVWGFFCWLPWFTARDDVASACPLYGVATVEDQLTFWGVKYEVRCVNGVLLQLDKHGRKEN